MRRRRRPHWPWKQHFAQGGAILLAAFGSLLVLTYPQWKTRDCDHGYRQAWNNLRSIGLEMCAFEIEYGAFPNHQTIAKVKAANPGSELSLSGDSSNDYFSQLLASNIATSENIFYAKAKSSILPDNVFGNDGNTLLPGNTSFAYISGLHSGKDVKTPLVFGPVIPGTLMLDHRIYKGRAVVLFTDLSVTTFKTDYDGNLQLGSKKILDLKRSTFDGKPVDIKWPK